MASLNLSLDYRRSHQGRRPQGTAAQVLLASRYCNSSSVKFLLLIVLLNFVQELGTSNIKFLFLCFWRISGVSRVGQRSWELVLSKLGVSRENKLKNICAQRLRLQRLWLLKRHHAWAVQFISSLIYPKRFIACTSDLHHSTQRPKLYQILNFHFWVNFPVKFSTWSENHEKETAASSEFKWFSLMSNLYGCRLVPCSAACWLLIFDTFTLVLCVCVRARAFVCVYFLL